MKRPFLIQSTEQQQGLGYGIKAEKLKGLELVSEGQNEAVEERKIMKTLSGKGTA